MELALVSCRELPEADPDAAPLSAALEAAGVDARVLAWDDPAVDWSRVELAVLRSSWNYPLQHERFLAWAERVDRVTKLWNPLAVVRWNTYKGYLLELARGGVPVVPTVLLRRGSQCSLDEVRKRQGWAEVVIKPAVSAASFHTYRFGPETLAAGEACLARLLSERDVLVQRYLASVERYGERALVWIDGELTHAVRKSPRFTGQDESVSARAVEVSDAEREVALRAIGHAPGELLYARVDVAPGPDGRPVVMELELVEPSLYLRQSDRALDRLVAAMRRFLGRAPRGQQP